MSVRKYRRIEDLPPTWRPAGDPSNLRVVAVLLAWGRRFARAAGLPLPPPGVQRFRSFEDAQAAEEPPPVVKEPNERR